MEISLRVKCTQIIEPALYALVNLVQIKRHIYITPITGNKKGTRKDAF
jgi:hypothetical protein